MKISAILFRSGALCLITYFCIAQPGASSAQTAPEVSPAPATILESLSQAELLKSYLQVQEQLHAAQLAIERNRAESEAAARAQASALTEKLDAIKTAMETDRQRQTEEMRRSNSTLLWVASAFGGVGLLAMMVTALFQWRTMSRMAEMATQHPQLAASVTQGLLPAETGASSGKAVALSNQRLMTVLDRLEHRIFELEHTATKPLSAGPAALPVEADATVPAADDQAARITVLLGKGQSLLNTDKAEAAIACYDEILFLDANHPEALVKKGAALERLKQDEEALRCYDRAIEADRRMTVAYLYKGGVYNRLERYNEALECYEQALRVQDGAA